MEGQLLPESKRMDALPDWCFFLLSFVLTTCYYICVGADLSPSPLSRLPSRRKALQRIALAAAALVLFGAGAALCRRAIRRAILRAGGAVRELWPPLVGYVLFGAAVEAILRCGRRLVDGDDPEAAPGPPAATTRCPRRFAVFLLVAGTYCLQLSWEQRVRNDYEYVGPMRITKAPTLHKMDRIYDEDLLDAWPCLKEGRAPGTPLYLEPLERDWIEVTLEVGWGKAWGCREATDKWNTNWPSWRPCASFICVDGDGDRRQAAPACPCQTDEAAARNASRQCIEAAFDLSRLEGGSGPRNGTGEDFDEDTPPWEDPAWPSVVRYGSCAGNVGVSYEVDFVERKAARARALRNFGGGCLLAGLVALVACGCLSDGGRRTVREQGE